MPMRSQRSVVWTAAVLALVGATGVMAQSDQTQTSDRFELGSTPSERLVRAWNIDISPDGDNLPEGSGSVATGKTIYQHQCIACHGSRGEGGPMGDLAGGEGTLNTKTPVKSVGSYWPYATTLFDYIHRAMPFNDPQSLSDDQVYAVTAYVLHLNGIVPEDAVMDRDSLAKVEMPNRGGFKQIDTVTRAPNRACMTDCTPLEVRMQGTSPSRIKKEQVQ